MSRNLGPFRADLHVEIEPIETVEPTRRVPTGLRTLLGLCALAALVAWVAVDLRGSGPPAGPVFEHPAPDAGESLYTALRLVGVEPIRAQELPGVWWGAVLAFSVTTFGDDDVPFRAGRYELTAACVGRGQARLRWQATTGASGERSIDCTADGGVTTDTIVLSAQAAITVMVSTADGRDAPATIAVMLTDPRIVAARAALGPGDQPPVLSGADLSLGYQREFTNVAPGAYRLTFVCVGTGRLQIRTWLGVNPPPTQELPCSQDGERLEFDVASSTVDTFVMAVLEIGGPPGVSGFAFRLDRAPALDPGPAA